MPGRRQSALAAALVQMAAVAGLVVATATLAAVGAAPIARILYVAGALALAAFFMRRSPWDYLTVTLWFWTISPFVRRLIDHFGGFEVVNPVLIAPNVVSLLMLRDVLGSRALLRHREAAVAMLVALPMGYGLAVSLFRGDVFPGAVAASDWFVPLLFYFYLIAHAARIGEAERHLQAFVPLNMLVVVGYGLYQYFSPPIWDAQWVIDSRMITAGLPVPYGLKPFSTLNSPGPCAVWISSLLLLSLHFRRTVSLVLLPAALLLLAVTLVRASMGALLLGLAVAALLGNSRMLRAMLLLGLAVASVVFIVAALNPRVSQTLVARFDTTQNIGQDYSARARAALYREAPALIDAYPLGLGIGALGRGAVAAGDAGLVNVDAGPIAVYLALGWVAGSFYLLGMLAVAAQALVTARATASPAGIAMAVSALAGVSVLAFVNLVGFQAMVIWMSAGYAAAIGIRARERDTDAVPRASKRQIPAWAR